MIHVDGLCKLYGQHLAVDGASLDLAPGAVCGLVGSNGAGKTTTLRCMSGLIPTTAGRIQVDGKCLSADAKSIKRILAYVPDDPPLFDDLTVVEHLHFIGRLYQVNDSEKKAVELLAQFDLTAKSHTNTFALSRGMRQKLAICCAYMFDPKVLLLDEPLTGLDPPSIRVLLDSIRKRADEGAAVIISSHLLAMIEDVCSHLMVMDHGLVRYFGESAGLLSRYPSAGSLEAAFFAAKNDTVDGTAAAAGSVVAMGSGAETVPGHPECTI